MELIWEYDEHGVRKVEISELISIANGLSMLRSSIGLIEEGFQRTGGGETYPYNLIDERIDLGLKELPALVLRARTALLEQHCDEMVSRAANIFAERWLHAKTPRYCYSDVMDLEWDLVDTIVTFGNRDNTFGANKMTS
jgi:hypothetical protein